MPTIPTWLWKAWLGGVGIIALWFTVMEGIALINKIRGDTFSEFVWRDHLPAVLFFLGAGLVIFGTIWLLIHFVSGGKWGI
jgi:uncharacterized integral membrane protein